MNASGTVNSQLLRETSAEECPARVESRICPGRAHQARDLLTHQHECHVKRDVIVMRNARL